VKKGGESREREGRVKRGKRNCKRKGKMLCHDSPLNSQFPSSSLFFFTLSPSSQFPLHSHSPSSSSFLAVSSLHSPLPSNTPLPSPTLNFNFSKNNSLHPPPPRNELSPGHEETSKKSFPNFLRALSHRHN